MFTVNTKYSSSKATSLMHQTKYKNLGHTCEILLSRIKSFSINPEQHNSCRKLHKIRPSSIPSIIAWGSNLLLLSTPYNLHPHNIKNSRLRKVQFMRTNKMQYLRVIVKAAKGGVWRVDRQVYNLLSYPRIVSNLYRHITVLMSLIDG